MPTSHSRITKEAENCSTFLLLDDIPRPGKLHLVVAHYHGLYWCTYNYLKITFYGIINNS